MTASLAGRRLGETGRDVLLGLGAVALAGLMVANARRDPTEFQDALPTVAAARAAIDRNPLDVVALRSLGMALDRQGNTRDAEAVMAFAALRSWRDWPTLAWLIPRRIAQGDYVNAFNQTDALMRQDIPNDGLREPLIKLMIAAAADNNARPAVVARLAGKPWWRKGFIPRLAVVSDVDSVRAVLLALAQSPGPASGDEVAPFLQRLVDAGDYAGAAGLWAALSPGARSTPGFIGDGDFSAPADPTVFGWSVAAGVGATSAIEAPPGGRAGVALRVDYDGFSTPTLPRRLLVLGPGRYRLTWNEWRDRGAPRRLDWAARCADSGATVSQAPAPPAGGDWRPSTMMVEVPATGCRGQWLSLIAIPGERRDPATVWYAGFDLEKAGEEFGRTATPPPSRAR